MPVTDARRGLNVALLVLLVGSVSTTTAVRAWDTCESAGELTHCQDVAWFSGSLQYAHNDYDPGTGGCADGDAAPGPDVACKMTVYVGESVSIYYTLEDGDGVAYVVTDCEDVAGTCIIGANDTGYGQAEHVYINGGGETTYYLILDAREPETGGAFEVEYGYGCSPYGWGACCLPEAVCYVTTSDECDDWGGSWTWNIDCDPDPCVGSGVDAADPLSNRPRLLLTRPNPFTTRAQIRYDIPTSAGDVHVRVEILDASGRRIRTLVDAALEGGTHGALWNGRTDKGLPAPAGAYLCRLAAMGSVETSRLLLLR